MYEYADLRIATETRPIRNKLDTEVRFVTRLLLIGFEILGHNWGDLAPAAVVTENALFSIEPVRARVLKG
jgi:hypothetical protein